MFHPTSTMKYSRLICMSVHNGSPSVRHCKRPYRSPSHMLITWDCRRLDTSMRSRPIVSVSPRWLPKPTMTWHSRSIPGGHHMVQNHWTGISRIFEYFTFAIHFEYLNILLGFAWFLHMWQWILSWEASRANIGFLSTNIRIYLPTFIPPKGVMVGMDCG